MKKLHIIGIAGKATSAIAVAFKQQGWQVTGSDISAYPPASTFLESQGITIKAPYAKENIPNDTELVMIGGSVGLDPENAEVQAALTRNLEVLTYPQMLQRFVVKHESIVTMGNFGKGTTAGAMVHVLTELGEDPSYMVGGQMLDYENNVAITDSQWSVMEGDEYPAPPLVFQGEVLQPRQSKFFFYKPKHVIFTSAEWDHFDVFQTPQGYIDNYNDLFTQLSEDGIAIVNLDGDSVFEAIAGTKATVKTYSYDNPQADYRTVDIPFKPVLFGGFNKHNLTAVYALCCELGFDQPKVLHALNRYHGLKQRLEVLLDSDEVVIIRDYAHSPVKAQSALESIREQYPNHHITTVFDIYASSLKNRAVLPQLKGRFKDTDEVFIPKVNLSTQLDRDEMVTGKEIADMLVNDGVNVSYLPSNDALYSRLVEDTHTPRVLVLMSSGNLSTLEEKLLQHFADD